MKKMFMLTKESILHNGVRLYRIKAVEDYPEFMGVKRGDLGGFVQSLDNLKEYGWVYQDGKVYGNAIISGTSYVRDSAEVYDNAALSGETEVSEKAKVFGECKVIDSVITSSSRVFGKSTLTKCTIADRARVGGKIKLEGVYMYNRMQRGIPRGGK